MFFLKRFINFLSKTVIHTNKNVSVFAFLQLFILVMIIVLRLIKIRLMNGLYNLKYFLKNEVAIKYLLLVSYSYNLSM